MSKLPRPITTISIFHNPDKPEIRTALPGLVRWLKGRGCRVVPTSQTVKAQAVVALGGDGTLLSAGQAAAIQGLPVVGINFGRLGFLSAADYRRARAILSKLLAGRLAVSERLILSVEGPRGVQGWAVNDCVVHGRKAARLIRLSAWVNGKFLTTYVGDGVIISSPTGSTAYSLAASGPIAVPELDLLLVTPICPHSLTQRPIILPPGDVVELRLQARERGERVSVSLDGRTRWTLGSGDRLWVRRAETRLRLLTEEERPFFSLLREKLKWGER